MVLFFQFLPLLVSALGAGGTTVGGVTAAQAASAAAIAGSASQAGATKGKASAGSAQSGLAQAISGIGQSQQQGNPALEQLTQFRRGQLGGGRG